MHPSIFQSKIIAAPSPTYTVLNEECRFEGELVLMRPPLIEEPDSPMKEDFLLFANQEFDKTGRIYHEAPDAVKALADLYSAEQYAKREILAQKRGEDQPHHVESMAIRALLEKAGFHRPVPYVEVGPGAGFLLDRLPPGWAASWQGLEFCSTFIRHLCERYSLPPERIQQGDIVHFSNYYQAQELVIAVSVLPLISDLRKALQSVYQGLRPRGKFIILQTKCPPLLYATVYNQTHSRNQRIIVPHFSQLPFQEKDFSQLFEQMEQEEAYSFLIDERAAVTPDAEFYLRLTEAAEQSRFLVAYNGTITASCHLKYLHSESPQGYANFKGTPQRGRNVPGLNLRKEFPFSTIAPTYLNEGEAFQAVVWDAMILQKD